MPIPDGPQKLTTLYYRYRGAFDFNKLFKETKGFFTDRKMDVSEKIFKYKGNEYEGTINVDHRVDEYTKIQYTVEYKLSDFSFKEEERDGTIVKLTDGKLWMSISVSAIEHYSEEGIAGGKDIFPKTNKGKESWLHKVYNKVTFRDRDEGTYGQAVLLAHAYIDMVKAICGTEAQLQA